MNIPEKIQPFFVPLDAKGVTTFLGFVPKESSSIASVASQELDLEYGGVVGDRHFGETRKSCMRVSMIYDHLTEIRNVRQVTLICDDEIASVAAAMKIDEISPESLGANIRISGIPNLSLLPPSSRLVFKSGASLVVDLENAPCNHPAKLIKKPPADGIPFRQAAQYKRGVCAWVERPGRITMDDVVSVYVPSQPSYLSN